MGKRGGGATGRCVKEACIYVVIYTNIYIQYKSTKSISCNISNSRYINQSSESLELMTPKVMAHLHPNAKMIVIMRDPVTATYSSFNYYNSQVGVPTAAKFHDCVVIAINLFIACERRHSVERCTLSATREDNLPFDRACTWVIRSLRLGRYAFFLKQWFRHFPRENFYIVKMEKYIASKRPIIKDIWEFLGVQPVPLYLERELGRVQSIANHHPYKDPVMYPRTWQLLAKFFEIPNKELEVLIGDRKMSWQYTF